MAASDRPVRAGRSAPVVAVTGAAGEVGLRLVERLAGTDRVMRVVGVDTARVPTANVTWRTADVRDAALRSKLTGVSVVVHLATARDADVQASERRAINVVGTENVLAAARAAGVGRVVVVTSAMVYGAHPDNQVPLGEDAALRGVPGLTLVGDWLEMERLAARAARAPGGPEVVVVRPATLVGPGGDATLARHFDAPRLLAIRDGRPHWQFCHVEDLVSALESAVLGRVSGAVTVGCDGWLDQEAAEQVAGRRSVAVPAGVAFAAAERLHRIGVATAPAAELRYLQYPCVVGSQRLRSAGWTPRWDNASALRAHLDALPARRLGNGQGRRDAARAAAGAAGAAVALAGTLAIARARAQRRRLRG